MWARIKSWLLPQRLETRYSPFNGPVEVWRYGRETSLRVEGLTQSGGLTEEIWDKAIKTVNTYQLSVNSILILGLGGGTAAKVARRYWPQAKIVGVDADPVMVALGKQYLGLRGVKVVIADAAEFIKQTREKFDGILVDVYQGRKIPHAVASQQFLENLKRTGGWIIFNLLKTNQPFKQLVESVWPEPRRIRTPANELLLVK